MPAPYRTPGVYVEEISTLPPSIAEVATAVPAFIGYTEKRPGEGSAPVVERISTMLEYETDFGGPQLVSYSVSLKVDDKGHPAEAPQVVMQPLERAYSLYYALSHYFKNGGGPCYVVSVGTYLSTDPAIKARFEAGIDALAREDEPTLIVLTDAACLLTAAQYYDLCSTKALDQCKRLGDRFTIVDVVPGDTPGAAAEGLRKNLNSDYLMYGAAYHPYLKTSIGYRTDDARVTVTLTAAAPTEFNGELLLPAAGNGIAVKFTGPLGSKPRVVVKSGERKPPVAFDIVGDVLTIDDAADADGTEMAAEWQKWTTTEGITPKFSVSADGTGEAKLARSLPETPLAAVAAAGDTTSSLATLKKDNTAVYGRIRSALEDQYVMLPPSAAVAGVYARVDRDHGVWKAPANVNVMAVLGPAAKITDQDQENLNVDATGGKSINAIRDFTGKGTLVWGSRTLAGNDNEWRYVPVRRLFITIEESARKASAFAVFEPNDQATWLKVKAMIESYLYGLWERGALAGSKPEQAYYVHVGLGATMTPQDVLEGRMVVEIGIAAVRPAEFIVLRFSHKLQTA